MPCFWGHQQLKRPLFLWNAFLPSGCRWNVILGPEFTVSFVEDQPIILDFQSAPWIFKAVKGVRTNKSASSSSGTSIWVFGPNPANCISIRLYASGRAALLEICTGPRFSRSLNSFLNWKFLMKLLLSSFTLSSQPDVGGQSSCTVYVRGAQTRGSEHRDHVAQLEGSNDSSSFFP